MLASASKMADLLNADVTSQFDTLDEANECIQSTGVRFVKRTSRPKWDNSIPTCDTVLSKRVLTSFTRRDSKSPSIPFNGHPFVQMRTGYYECVHGKPSKRPREQISTEVGHDYQKKSHSCVKVTRKLGCERVAVMSKVAYLMNESLKVLDEPMKAQVKNSVHAQVRNNVKRVVDCGEQLDIRVSYFVRFSGCHVRHPVGQASGRFNGIHEKIKEKMRSLFSDEGIVDPKSIRRLLKPYATLLLGHEPDPSDRAYSPTHRDVINFITRYRRRAQAVSDSFDQDIMMPYVEIWQERGDLVHEVKLEPDADLEATFIGDEIYLPEPELHRSDLETGIMAPPARLALFGLGRAGVIHLANLAAYAHTTLTHVVELDVELARRLLTSHNLGDVIVHTPDEAQLVFEDQSVDGVVVCTPTFTHEAYVTAALNHGKAVFCEKPISEDLRATWACYEGARKAGRPLVCSFNRRFDPSFVSVRERTLAGAAGTVHTVHTVARDHPLPPLDYLKVSGGIFHDCAVHDIDVICWTLGEFPSSVMVEAHAHHKAIRKLSDVDTAVLVLRFPSDVIASVTLSRHASYGYDQRIEVFGSGGMVVSENQRPTEVVCYTAQGARAPPMCYSFPQRYKESYMNSLQHFVRVIRGEEESLVRGNETLAVSIVADACERSYRTRSRVSLDLARFLQPELVDEAGLADFLTNK